MIMMMSSMFWFLLIPLFTFVDGQVATCGVGDATPLLIVFEESEVSDTSGFGWQVRQLGVDGPITSGEFISGGHTVELCLDPSGCYFVRLDVCYGYSLPDGYNTVFYLIFSGITFHPVNTNSNPIDSINFGDGCPSPEPPPVFSPDSEPEGFPDIAPVFSPDSEPQEFPRMAPGFSPVNSPTSSNNDVLTCSCTGDPNYKMWNDEYFSFQGNCDQILIDNNYLQLQVRTRPSINFSLISQVALKLKNPDRTVFQFNRGNNPIIKLDGSEMQYETTNEKFFYAQYGTYISPFPTHTFTFNEGGRDQYIKVTETWHGGFGVNVKGTIEHPSYIDRFRGSKGMCGNWNAGGMTKRDEDDGIITVTTPTAINAVRSWQVNDGESILFEPSTYCEDFTEHCNHISFPDTTFDCYDEGLRMLQNNQGNSTVTPKSDIECADLSCAAIIDPIMREFCQSDVRISGDPRWACQIDYLISPAPPQSSTHSPTQTKALKGTKTPKATKDKKATKDQKATKGPK